MALVVKSFEHMQWHGIECVVIGAFEYHKWRHASCQGFYPARHAQAPLITRHKAWKAPFRHRRTQVIAGALAEFQKFRSHHRAYDMRAFIICIGFAAAITKKSG